MCLVILLHGVRCCLFPSLITMHVMGSGENMRAYFCHVKLAIWFLGFMSIATLTQMSQNRKGPGSTDPIYGSDSTFFVTSLGNTNQTIYGFVEPGPGYCSSNIAVLWLAFFFALMAHPRM